MDKENFAHLLREAIHSVQFMRRIGNIPEARTQIGNAAYVGEATIEAWSRKKNPKVPNCIDSDLLERLVAYCIANSRLDRRWARSILSAAHYRGSNHYVSIEDFLDTLFPNKGDVVQPRVILCYQRDQMIDAELAREIISTLTRTCTVWVEPPAQIGPKWDQQLTDNLRNADYVIILLSAAAVHGGEMLKTLIEKGESLSAESGHSYSYLPVRVNYRRPFKGIFAHHFNHLNWVYWESNQNTDELLQALQSAISGGLLPINADKKPSFIEQEPLLDALIPPQPGAFILRDGAIDFESNFYLERDADRLTLKAIQQPTATIVLKGPSQIGKSSLLIRLKNEAESIGKNVAYRDFGLLYTEVDNSDRFFENFINWFMEEAGEQTPYERHPLRTITRGITKHIENHVLPKLEANLVLMIDEADALFKFPYHEDFFSMLRAWHNRRAHRKGWEKLDIVLVTSTEEYLYILDKNRSPFNIGLVVDLLDFSHAQIQKLNMRYNHPFNEKELLKLMGFVSGHPYLTRKAMYEVAAGNISAERFFETIADENGPFGDHLRAILLNRIGSRADLIEGMKGMLHGQSLEEKFFWHLKGAGLIERVDKQILWRRKLYELFFIRYLS